LSRSEEGIHAYEEGVKALVASDPTSNVVNRFHVLFYGEMLGKTWSDTRWLGVPLLKNPFDLWVYQQTVFEVKPDVIIECGTFRGGSALFFASLFDLIGTGEVITIDIEALPQRPSHKRITYLTGSSTSGEIVLRVRKLVKGKAKVFVILDSEHSKRHVLDEMKQYSELVTEGSYMVVEDTNVNGHPVAPDWGPGPKEAVEEFLVTNRDFVRDATREEFYMTFFPGGWLKRVRNSSHVQSVNTPKKSEETAHVLPS
jgi:cephalosporin hydroxylase